MKRLLAAYADRECAMDFTQAALTAGFRGRRTLSVLFVPLAVLCFRREGASDALTIRWIETELLLWWLSALALLPPTRPLWRHRKPGFMRHAAPVLSALAPALLIARAVLAVLLPMAAAQSGLWPPILRTLAAWGALLMGQAVCLTLLPCLRPTRLQTVGSVAVMLILAGSWR